MLYINHVNNNYLMYMKTTDDIVSYHDDKSNKKTMRPVHITSLK